MVSRYHSVAIADASVSPVCVSSDASGGLTGVSSDGAVTDAASCSPSAVTSGSANGLSLIGLVALLVGETDSVWITGGDVACGILHDDRRSEATNETMRAEAYFSGLGIAVPTVF